MSDQIKVSVDKLGSAISDMLETYSQEVSREMPEIIKDITKDTVKDLKDRASKLFGGKEYKKSFKSKKITSTSDKAVYKIYSEEYRLVHLLEHGHAIKNQTGKVYGKTPAKPHWQPAEEKAVKALEDRITEKL